MRLNPARRNQILSYNQNGEIYHEIVNLIIIEKDKFSETKIAGFVLVGHISKWTFIKDLEKSN